MSDDVGGFDLDAAWIRRAQSDMRAFMEALAVRLEGALPGRVEVERRRDGLLSKTSHVSKIVLTGERTVYEITKAGGGVKAMRAKSVRGVTISSAELTVAEWVREVRLEIGKLAEQANAAADVLRDFL